ncbi:MAG TPA: DUF1015 domain-containing protein [Candidatus Limnocylindria bacterium]|nr:DUF1015 domain-containing protein [Candidatus Limnocylindria bacterium]
MPQLRPFRGLRYDPRFRPDAAALLCPPYDVISAGERARLAALDPRNAVHVELPVGAEGRDPYEHAAALFASWRAGGVLCRDDRPLVYAYEQVYSAARGGPLAARGFYCLLRLEDLAPGGGVRRHEHTMAGPKEDRYRLLRAVEANLSPVVLLYESGNDGAAAASALARLMNGRPALEADGADGADGADSAGEGAHRLWTADPAVDAAAASLLELAAACPLTIADGHHRYETALRYRDERRAGAQDAGPAEWLMVLLVEAVSGGLSVLPTHRLVEEVADGAQRLLFAAQELFRLTPVEDRQALLAALDRPGRLGLWTAERGVLLEPLPEALASLLPAGTDALRQLDVSALSAALPRLVGEETQALLDSGRLHYVKDANEAISRAGEADGAAFLLPATPVRAVLEVAAAGEQMPHKSTYFEPKPATGLVFNALAE